MKTLGEKLSGLRKNKGISQETLSTEIGKARSNYAMWELDKAIPNQENLKKLATFFEVPLSYFYEYGTSSLSPKDDLSLFLKQDNIFWEGVRLKEHEISFITSFYEAVIDERKKTLETQEKLSSIASLVQA